MPLRSKVLPALAALALAAPATASAADLTYDVSAFTFVQGTAAGTDGDGWDSSSSFYTEIDQQIDDLPATDDQTSVVGVPKHHRIFVSTLKQSYSLVTVVDTLTWGCVQSGDAKGAPGGVTMTREDDTWTVDLVVAQGLTQSRDCTGFSSFADEIEIAPGPVATTFTIPAAELERTGSFHRTIDEPVPCGEWTIFQTACNLRLQGTVSVDRRGVQPPPKEEKPIKKVTARLLPDNKGAAVTVTCKKACDGTLSATAVAKAKLRAKKVAEKPFSNPSPAPRKVEVIFGGRGSRAVRSRGAVVIDVRSGGQSRSVRLQAR